MSSAIPSDWKLNSIGNVIEHIIDFRGRTPKKLGMDWGNGNIRALSANNVQMGKVNFEKECYLASDDLYEKWMTKGDTKKDDVLFTMEAPLGNVALVPDQRKYILSQRVILLRPNRSEILPLFLYQQMRGEHFQRQLTENSTGSTALGIQQKRLVQLELNCPPKLEQQKIATILTSVDNVIEKTEAQINKLQDLKKGMMQELLSPQEGSKQAKACGHTEFKDSPVGRIPKGWVVMTLSELVKPNKKITYGIVQAGPNLDEGVPYIRVSDMSGRTLSPKGMMKTSFEIAGKYKRSEVSSGDIVYALRGMIGHVLIVPSSLDGANLTQGTARISANELIMTEYLLWALRSPFISFQTDLEAKGSTFKEMTLASLNKLKVCVPPREEQKVLSDTLNSIEKSIEKNEVKLQSYQELKKALMQDLLTGKVRVKTD